MNAAQPPPHAMEHGTALFRALEYESQLAQDGPGGEVTLSVHDHVQCVRCSVSRDLESQYELMGRCAGSALHVIQQRIRGSDIVLYIPVGAMANAVSIRYSNVL